MNSSTSPFVADNHHSAGPTSARPAATETAWPVMVLAHNEERHIAACLDSIFEASAVREPEVFVMANGCTDATESIVAEYGRRRSHVHLVSIALGDKCNAWNAFIHDVAANRCPDRDIYFFMDGDARATRGAFDVMARALSSSPHAHAASAVPVSGRNVERDRRGLLEEHALVANLYALRGSFVQRLRAERVRIPLKLEGDDGLIGALVKWDLDPQRNGFDDSRIVPCAEAGFAFESMSLARPSDWRMYWKRAVRYGRRRYEFKLLAQPMKARGIAALPADIMELYPLANDLRLMWDGLYTLPNWVALRTMRKIGSRSAGHGS